MFAHACMASMVLAGWLAAATPAYAAGPQPPSATPVAHPKKHRAKKPKDRCDPIGKPCTQGDDCLAENCKPGGAPPAPGKPEAPAPE